MKKKILWIILCFLFLIVFNVVFFVVGGMEHKASVWISYGFIHFAYFMLLVTPKLIRGGESEAVFGFSLFTISSTYLLVEFFIGVLFILISLNGYKAALLIQICIAGFYGVALVSNMIANEHTADAEEKRRHQIAYVKEASTRLKHLLDNIGDKEAKKKVERAYDAMDSSPVQSRPDLEHMENRIFQTIKELEFSVSTGNKDRIISLANILLASINERNLLQKK